MNLDPSWYRQLKRIPLFQKILIANSAIVGLGAVIGTVVTVWHVRLFPADIHYELIGFFALGGVVISYLVNNWVLKRALDPLDRLQTGVDRVAQGDLTVRVERSPVSDERFDRLTDTFNRMLAQLEQDATQLRQLSHQILQAQEDERQRLARELHDEAAQALTSLLVRLRLLERAHTPEEAQLRVAELRELTAQALEDVRRVALDLRPTILDDLGLAPALEWRVEELSATGSIQATFLATGLHQRLPRELELVFYRVGQEALSNVVRHAQASQVSVQLAHRAGRVNLEIQDDGVGFQPDQPMPANAPRGLGLLGMRERLGMVGGDLMIASAPGQGTQIRASAAVDLGRIKGNKEY